MHSRRQFLWLWAPVLVSGAAPAKAQRIVSTSPSITECLFAMGVGNRVVGVSNYCSYPEAVKKLPKIGSFVHPDAEKIALLSPDLVIAHKGASNLPDRLRALHIPCLEVTVETLPQVYGLIEQLGQATGEPAAATKLGGQIRKHLQDVSERTQGQPKLSVLIIIGRDPGRLTNLIAAGPNAYLTQLLEVAGGKNIFTETNLPAYVHVGFESILRRNPDVIMDLSKMGDSDQNREELRTAWLSREELTAVKRRRIFALTNQFLVTPGPRAVAAVDLLASTIAEARRL